MGSGKRPSVGQPGRSLLGHRQSAAPRRGSTERSCARIATTGVGQQAPGGASRSADPSRNCRRLATSWSEQREFGRGQVAEFCRPGAARELGCPFLIEGPGLARRSPPIALAGWPGREPSPLRDAIDAIARSVRARPRNQAVDDRAQRVPGAADRVVRGPGAKRGPVRRHGDP